MRSPDAVTDTAASTHPDPLPFDRVQADERRHFGEAPGGAQSALCLSGGGVRSASFSLGVLQALSRAGVLDKFDYLSTVSGGGYIGGWLSAWRIRAKTKGGPDPCLTLDGLAPGGDEPAPLGRLRAFIEYLTPHTGILSADVWTLAGTMLRNLIVNWLILIPVIAAAAMLPRLYLGVLGLPSQELLSLETLEAWFSSAGILMSVLVAIAATYAALQLPSLGRRPFGLIGFLVWFLAPVLIVHVLLSVHRFWAPHFDVGAGASLGSQMLVSAGGMVLPWLAGGAFGGRLWQPRIWIAAAVAGALGRLAAWKLHALAAVIANNDPQAFAVLDLTGSLAMLFLQVALFIGLASREMTDEDREWWARTGAWILISAAAWLAVSSVVILGPVALNAALDWIGVTHASGRTGLGLLAILGGLAQRASGGAALLSGAGWLRSLVASLAAPFVTLALFVLASDANGVLLNAVHERQFFPEHAHVLGASLPEDLVGFGLLALVGLGLGRVIAVNRFSLHGMYRFRLVRTFLGASRPSDERHPSPFTGFDANDDLRMADLASLGRPFHVVNATLNTVANTRLATAERQARPFTFSALHSGAAGVGYRPSAEYAGGITLGDAITTSGAAANSNMGAGASAVQTFLLTLFNARLGEWLGNPGTPGRQTWMRPAPSFGAGPLLNELTARTTDTNPYVNLSDGGHFDNLGAYEMIRRRCRTIVIVDAGADPAFAFGDLANLIRRVRIDFGVSVVFPDGLPMGPSAPADRRRRWAVAAINYHDADPTVQDGVLLYIKPTVLGDEPVDVANYAHANPPFPHQSTVNQWFGAAEFESYRALGWHTVATLCGARTFTDPRELCDAATHPGALTS